ncbi:MAG: GTP-binding protein [Cyanobacteria bacterium P01_E01_bin.34]
MTDPAIPHLPVTLVIGFRHCGKSTIVRNLASQLPEPIARLGTEIERTPTDCICCSGSDSLQAALSEILEQHRASPFTRLFVEGSDETDPVPVMRAIRNRFNHTPLVLREIITAISTIAYPPASAPAWLVTNQIFFADRIALTHCDLATPAQILHCQQQVQSIKGVPIVKCQPDQVNIDQLLTAR